MQLITSEYRKLNSELHKTNKNYGTSGRLYVSDILKLCKKYDTRDILDYGCGKNTLANNLPFPIHQFDPAIPAFDAMPMAADIVVCTDVAEHIEPELLDNVLGHIASLTKKVCYMTCATRPAMKTLADGRNAHLIVENGEWWKEKLQQYFDILVMHETAEHGVYVMEPKKEGLSNA